MSDGFNYDNMLVYNCGPKATMDDLPAIMAQYSMGSDASVAKNYRDKVIMYNDLMSRIVPIQRQIAALKSRLLSNETVKKVIDNLKWMSDNCKDMESYELTKTHIVIKTNDLKTDIPINGHIRKLGKFAILIQIPGLIGDYESISNGKLIKVFNLTRTHNDDGGDSWMCGHIGESGNACFGNATSMLVDAFAQSDVFQIFDIVLRFIRNPDEKDSWGYHMKHWPWAEEVTVTP
jgi:hypothetical protein